MRALLLIFCYVMAVGVGFLLRARFDVWMYTKPHMQARYRVMAAEVAADPSPIGETLYFPPLTTDQFALSPARTRAWLDEYSRLQDDLPESLPPVDEPFTEDAPTALSGAPPETARASPPSDRPIEPV